MRVPLVFRPIQFVVDVLHIQWFIITTHFAIFIPYFGCWSINIFFELKTSNFFLFRFLIFYICIGSFKNWHTKFLFESITGSFVINYTRLSSSKIIFVFINWSWKCIFSCTYSFNYICAFLLCKFFALCLVIDFRFPCQIRYNRLSCSFLCN